ncbi:hypothetical protein DMH02_004055 [Streptomyces sp. WAC 00631]|uniref:hypothetical protein n=1 Tax=Streptomyces sp. WAC 00631 TaxID=2203201 RepID=UPI001E609AC9|nr:hypothetical protein [Streptomyces sp. WAC 00631]MCC5032444.1 hypothetical protein [Streptomyces sp. WAC 00631]
MAACVVPGGSSWAGDDSERHIWVVVIVLVMGVVASGALDSDQALQVLSLLAALAHRDR